MAYYPTNFYSSYPQQQFPQYQYQYQQAQNQYLVNQIKSCAIPAYITCSPYESAFIGGSRCGYGCNS